MILRLALSAAITLSVFPASAAAQGQVFDPTLEAQNFAKLQERKSEIVLTPAFQARMQQQNAQDAIDLPLLLANDPERNPLGNVCAQRKNECAGDVRFYDGWDGSFGTRTPVLFTGRSGATLSGNVFSTRTGPAQKPGIVITTGSVQAPEPLYWGIAEALAKSGYIVLTYDVQGQGRSDTFGEGVDQQEGVPSQNGRPFFDGTVDATDFLLSTAAHPYVPRPSCTTGTSHAPKQARRVAAGLNAPYNPVGTAVDASRIGIAGHSLGAGAVSFIGQRDNRVDAIVAWDNLGTAQGAGSGQSACPFALPDEDRSAKPLSPATAGQFKPVMGMGNDYGLTQSPFTSLPADRNARATAFDAFAAAGVDAMQLVTRGGSHFEYSFIPGNTAPDQLANATFRGMDMATWYTIAWFDKYVKGDPTADARLLTNRWCNDAPEAAVDNRGDGNLYSFYFNSKINFTRSGGGDAIVGDMRAMCTAPNSVLAPDGRPVPFDQLGFSTTRDPGNPPTTDTDGDGTPDISDSCPTVAGPPSNAGCPVPTDTDGDGVPDAADACPTVAGSPNNDGCPTPGDADADGVPDAADACPNQPGSRDNQGCPFPGDRDGDGVADAADACPDQQGPVANDGCPRPGDRDADGVPNAADACPDVFGPASNDGCPPPGDRDGDGVADGADACPDAFGPASSQGCPAFGDRDGDGVVNASDSCPDVAGSPSNEGCPLPGDRDGDGVANAADACPDTPGPAANNGCPPAGDRDGDGVANAADACPDTPGSAANNGCPPAGDRDGDGVPDGLDACPDVSGPASSQGCPAFGDRDGDGVVDAADACPDVAGSALNAGCPKSERRCSGKVLRVGLGRNLVRGTTGPDRILGGPRADRLRGSSGNDCIRGRGGNDRISGGGGRDLLIGGAGADRIRSRGGGADTVRCGSGRDIAIVDKRDRTRGCEIVRRR